MDLQDPTAKMSKSADSPQGTIALLDDPTSITKQIKSAVTDSGDRGPLRPRRRSPASRTCSQILAAATGQDRSTRSRPSSRAGGYGALKAAVADAVVEFLAPVQERYAELDADPGRGRRAARARAPRRPRRSPTAVDGPRPRAAGLLLARHADVARRATVAR